MPETDLASPFQRKKTIPMQDGMQGRQQNISKELLPACRNSQMTTLLTRVARGWL